MKLFKSQNTMNQIPNLDIQGIFLFIFCIVVHVLVIEGLNCETFLDTVSINHFINFPLFEDECDDESEDELH